MPRYDTRSAVRAKILRLTHANISTHQIYSMRTTCARILTILRNAHRKLILYCPTPLKKQNSRTHLAEANQYKHKRNCFLTPFHHVNKMRYDFTALLKGVIEKHGDAAHEKSTLDSF